MTDRRICGKFHRHPSTKYKKRYRVKRLNFVAHYMSTVMRNRR